MIRMVRGGIKIIRKNLSLNQIYSSSFCCCWWWWKNTII